MNIHLKRRILREKVSSISAQLADIRQRFENFQYQGWKNLLGDRLEDMLNSRELTEAVLTDTDNNLRYGAFCLISGHWKPSPHHELFYKYVATFDPDVRVRAAALGCFAMLNSGTRDKQAGSQLAAIVVDRLAPILMRRTAYYGLHWIEDKAMRGDFVSWIHRSDEDLPEDLDWDLVKLFLD